MDIFGAKLQDKGPFTVVNKLMPTNNIVLFAYMADH